MNTNNFIAFSKATKWLLRLFKIGMLLALVSAVLNLYQVWFFVDLIYHPDNIVSMATDIGPADITMKVVGIFEIALTAATTVLFLFWIWMASHNLNKLGAVNLNFTPTWAVGWFFIPIMSFWKPLQVVQQIYQASVKPKNWNWVHVPPIITWWWVVLWVRFIVSKIILRLLRTANVYDQFIVGLTALVLIDLLEILFFVLAHKVVELIYYAQIYSARNPDSDDSSSSPPIQRVKALSGFTALNT